MHYASMTAFLHDGRAALARGPVALVLAEDGVELASTLRHHLHLGFRAVVAFLSPGVPVPDLTDGRLVTVTADVLGPEAMVGTVNACIRAAVPGTWLHYGFNAEYLFYPFCETRRVGEVATFATEERRDAILTYVIDLYAPDLAAHPSAVTLDDAHLDRTGYYALARWEDGKVVERQMDFFGGLRWRFEEHVPYPKRRIDRIGLFRARPGLTLLADHRLSDAEMNTYACPWHNNLTAAICSFRTAKALRRNPGSAEAIETFRWHNSAPFAWHSQQLMDLGLMEPGQWF
jgi:hypothetical protein